ncbi:MAG: hypothetical protein HY922_02830 [Elusimicrobia bacterium]|nr:hypothetical protein [Elusimicrobiota bacterium]
MKTTNEKPVRRAWASLLSAVLAAESFLAGAAPAWAQRRKAEPEANPQFQEDSRKETRGGAPIGEGAAEAAPAPEAEQPQPEAEEPAPGGPQFPPRPAPNVQIGATQTRRAVPAEPTDPLETRIVVRVKSAPLSTFLDTISAQAKVNFIITEGLEEKRITAFLQNVTVREALQILLEIKGLTYQRIGRSNTYVVSPRAKGVPNRITRIYNLNYIPLMSMSGGQADFTPGGQQGGGGGGQQQQGIAILTVLFSVLTKEYGSVAIDARTNSLIITDIPEVFPQVEQILAELDKKSPQVMIEAQIVEIDSDRAQNIGLEWGGAKGELGVYTGPIRDTTFPLNMPTNLTKARFFDPLTNIVSNLGQQAAGGNTAGQGGGSAEGTGESTAYRGLVLGSNLQTGLLDLTTLRVVLRALVTRSEARFLGKPKILTLNSKSAVIQISQNQAVAINQQLTAGQGTTMTTAQAERFPTGLTLRVTPQINKEGYISMLVEPSFSNVIESMISSQSNSVFDPTTRAASTLVRVKNGQTLVLGGLLESRETKAVRKVPLLGYIPLIGWLFTSVSTQRSNTDLVIFITPTIVND